MKDVSPARPAIKKAGGDRGGTVRTNLISAKANLMPRCNKGLVLETRQSNRPRSHCALQAADKRATLRVSSPMEWKRPRSWLQKPNQRAHLSGLAVGASLAEMGSQSWKQNQWSCNQNGSDDQRSCQGDMTGTLAHRSVKLRLVSHTPNTIHVHLCAQPPPGSAAALEDPRQRPGCVVARWWDPA